MRPRVLALLAFAGGCQVFAGLGDFEPNDDDDDGEGAEGTGATGNSGGAGGVTVGGGGVGPGGGGTGNIPESCSDLSMNGDETGTDCGGPCPACPVGQGCLVPTDCQTGICNGTCACNDHLVISEFRPRGPAGGSDEFVELYNATGAPITLDNQWLIESRPLNGANFDDRWVGKAASPDVIPPYTHFVVGGSSFNPTDKDDNLIAGISDGSIVRVVHAGSVVDTLCTCLASEICNAPSLCEGTVAVDPNDMAPNDRSLSRLLGGVQGNCQDTDDNALDFMVLESSDPQTLSEGPFPPGP